MAARSASPTRDAMEWTECLADGSVVHIRPIDPGDVSRERAFLARLSPEYRAYRFLGLVPGADKGVARELTDVDPESEVALVALKRNGEDGDEIGVARFRVSADGGHCDCAVTVDPEWQRRGIGRLLMQRLIGIARARGIRRMYAADAARCVGTHLLAERLGFHSRPDPEDPAVTTFELTLS